MAVSSYIAWIMGTMVGVPLLVCLWLAMFMLIKVMKGDDLL